MKRDDTEVQFTPSFAGWSTGVGLNGVVLLIPKDRLENSSRDPVWVPGLNF